MAGLTKEQKKMWGIVGLIIVGFLLFRAFGGSDARATEPTQWEITDFTKLGGQSFDPDEKVTIYVDVKNLQNVTSSITLEGLILSDNVAENMSLASRAAGVVSPTPNCYESETFVTTVNLEDVEPYETITATLELTMPNTDTETQDGTSNWGDSFVEIVGLYDSCGGYETYSKDTFVLVGKEAIGETCETKADCSGWLWKGLSCVHGECVDSTIQNDVWSGIDVDFSSVTDFYENNTLAFWVIISSLGFLSILFMFRQPKGKTYGR